MSDPAQIASRIEALARSRGAYRAEAYLFVLHALERSSEMVGRPGHVTGPELLDGIRSLAGERYGPLAKDVFNAWGVGTTLDFGHIVFHLVEAGLLLKTPQDTLDEFADRYDFRQVFEDDYFSRRA